MAGQPEESVGEVEKEPSIDGTASGTEIPEPALWPGVLTALCAEVAGLRALVEERLRADESKDEAFRRLYQDLELYRGIASGAQSRPLLLDIILLLDRVEKSLDCNGDGAVFATSVRDELVEILARRGVERIAVAEPTFDPQRQRAVGTRAAPDGDTHNTVAEIVRAGYECDGQLLRATEVIVHRMPVSGSS